MRLTETVCVAGGRVDVIGGWVRLAGGRVCVAGGWVGAIGGRVGVVGDTVDAAGDRVGAADAHAASKLSMVAKIVKCKITFTVPLARTLRVGTA